MSDQYRTTSTSAQSFDVERLNEDGEYEDCIEIERSPSETTRKVIKALIIRNAENPQQKVKLTIVHQRKLPSNEWEDCESINLGTLKGGEGVKLALSSSSTYELFEQLRNIYEVASSDSYGYGTQDLIVGRADEMIRIEASRAILIRRLLDEGYSEEVWQNLAEAQPDLATRLSLARIQQSRIESLDLFEEMLSGSHPEGEWQSFFEDNKWIFGYGLKYVFLNEVTPQPNYGGGSIMGEGQQRGDFLESSIAEISFTVLVEIKKPDTLIVLNTLNRSGVSKLSKDLLNGTNQLQVNSQRWEVSGSQLPENAEELNENNIYTIKPKSILVIGHTRQLDNLNKRRSFQTFRSNLNEPEIITYDELFNRARYIVQP